MIDVSYGVLNYNPTNNQKAIDAYTRSVQSLAHNRNFDFESETYLIDQDSQPDLTQRLARNYGFRSILLEENVGISRGINILARLARGNYISLVTSDVEFPSLLDSQLIDVLEKNPDIGQVCAASNKSSLPHQIHVPNGQLIYNLVQELTIQFWPRKIFDTVGYFDERWKACYENIDFGLRIFLSGGLVALHQGILCFHEHNMCTQTGAINHAYDGYIDMKNGLDHGPLLTLWNWKWPNIKKYIDIYQTLPQNSEALRRYLLMIPKFRDNIYLPYVQNVRY